MSIMLNRSEAVPTEIIMMELMGIRGLVSETVIVVIAY
jgi:hypothetical protein